MNRKNKRTIDNNYQGISTLEVLEEAKNYNNWIADEILTHVVSPTLEVGAGIGNLTQFFLKKTPLHVTDKDAWLVEKLKKRFMGKKEVQVEVLDITQKPSLKYASYFSTIFAINVLEHIENDDIALQHMYYQLKHTGKLLLLVPAKKIAYTRLDRELGHIRRYEKNELIHKITENGFLIEKIYYFNIVGLLSWIIRDKVKRNNIHLKPYHIYLFDSIVPFLRIMEAMIKIPVGISLIVVAKKK